MNTKREQIREDLVSLACKINKAREQCEAALSAFEGDDDLPLAIKAGARAMIDTMLGQFDRDLRWCVQSIARCQGSLEPQPPEMRTPISKIVVDVQDPDAT